MTQDDESVHTTRDRASSGMLRKELDMRLTAYVPAVVRRHIERQDLAQELPMSTTHRTMVVSMFADVSGFTAMTESLAARGPVGAEDLAKHLNSYFEQLLRLVSSAGGDVFKFAGDAMLIFWPESKEDTMDSLLRRALQCALRIQTHLHEAELARGVVLSVKVGVGIGEATIAHLGGESDGATTRIEYVAVGPALEQAFSAEHQAEAGDVICSSECWQRVSEFFEGAPVQSHGSDGFHKVAGVKHPVKICSRRPSFTRHDALLHARMKQYVSRAVWPYLDAHDEFWGSELREVSVLFINLGFSEQDLAQMLGAKELLRLHDAFAKVQKCVYDYEGTINKFLVDDKGSTVIAAFGLPPVTHENDPVRAILASLAICAALGNNGLKASVGITTGTALCGVVGHQGNRREYTVLGDIVNLSARLMQRAKFENGGVLTDAPTKSYTEDVLHFEDRLQIMVKGKNESIKIHRPYPRMSILMGYHLSSSLQQPSGRPARSHAKSVVSRTPTMQNVMENMYRVQVRETQRRLSLRAERQCLPAEVLVESESFKKIRAALMDKCSQLNRFAPGGAFILEGDIGVGKTVLLRSALANLDVENYQVLVGTASPFATRKPYAIWSELITRAAADASRRRIPTVQGGREPEPHPNSDNQTAPVRIDASREVETERRECVAQFVRQKIREGAAPNTTLVRYAHLLNSILDTDFDACPDKPAAIGENNCDDFIPSENHDGVANEHAKEVKQPQTAEAPAFDGTLQVKEDEIAPWFMGLLKTDLAQQDDQESTSSDSTSDDVRDGNNAPENDEAEERESEWKPDDLDQSGILLLCALNAMSRDRATVFYLDNAMYMDEKSWTLVTSIAQYFTNCLVVVGARPPSLALGENTESSSFRKQLRLLKSMKSSTCGVLETFSSNDIDVLSRQILKVQSIPPGLLTILASRSQGNPLFLHEIITEMKEQEILEVDSTKGTCELHVQEPWGDKFKAEFCFGCHAKFVVKEKDKKVKIKKHRCKCCGYVFCPTCTPKACQMKLPGPNPELVRHCRTCYNLASSRRPSGTAQSGGVTIEKRSRSNKIRSMFHSGSSGGTSTLSSASSAAAQANSISNRVALRPPRTVKSVLTTMLDQLTVSQRMLMKTASAIGFEFDKEMLRATCPIEAHLARFDQDVEDLQRLAMIRRIDEPFIGVGFVPSKSAPKVQLKVKFKFDHGFMRGVIRAQMLRGQLDKLNSRIADIREQKDKEVRLLFLSKTSQISRPPQVGIPTSSAHSRGRALTPTGVSRSSATEGQRRRRNSHSGGEAFSSASPSSSESSTTQALNEDDNGVPVIHPSNVFANKLASPSVWCVRPTFNKLKTDKVFVKKQSSVFSHLKLKSLKKARQWKTRYAALYNSHLLLYYEESDITSVCTSGPIQGSSLSLRGAKVSECDPEVAAKVNCFQVEVSTWTKGKNEMHQRRSFVIAVESEEEVKNWIYLIRYAIESLENQPVNTLPSQ